MDFLRPIGQQALAEGPAVLDLDLAAESDLGNSQEGGDDGSCLGRLGVRGVAAADEQVVSAELFRGLCQRIARSQRVRAAERAV